MQQDRRFCFNAELRAGQSQGDEGATVVFGRAIAYGKLSLSGVPFAGAREQIWPGAFHTSLTNPAQPVIADFNHSNDYLPLGSTKNGTLQLDDRADGLHFELRLNPRIQMHRDVHQLVKDGTLSELSFTFGNAEDDWSTGTDDEDRSTFQLRTVRKAKLYGISLVNSPAYSGVTSASARSMRSLAYAFGPPVRPAASADLRARAAEIGKQIEYDRIMDIDRRSRETGFIRVRTGPGEWDWYWDAMTPEEHVTHLRKRAEQVGAEIRRQREAWLLDEIVSERRDPTNILDTRERGIYRPRIEVLQAELDSLLKEDYQ